MAGKKSKRLSQIARELNVGLSTLAEFLQKRGENIKPRPNVRVSGDFYELLLKEFSSDKDAKMESDELSKKPEPVEEEKPQSIFKEDDPESDTQKDDVEEAPQKKVAEKEVVKEDKEEENKKSEEVFSNNKLKGPQIVDKIDLDKKKPKEDTKKKEEEEKEKKRKDAEQKQKEEEQRKKKEAQLLKEKKEKLKKEQEEKVKQLAKKKAEEEKEKKKEAAGKNTGPQIVDKIDLDSINQKTRPDKKTKEELKKEREKRKRKKEAGKKAEPKEEQQKPEKEKKDDGFIKTKVDKLAGPTVVGKIELKEKDKKKPKKKKRKRIKKKVNKPGAKNTDRNHRANKTTNKSRRKRPEISEEDINKKINETLAKLEGNKTKRKTGAKNRRRKRDKQQADREIKQEQQLAESKVLTVTEFISANELASIMDVGVNDVIKKCFDLGKMVSINQRLDADTISIVTEEFGMKAEFVSLSDNEEVEEVVVDEALLEPRPPIVTVMGHVDHGKTSLLDFIRKTNVIAGEAGGITQHIGAYNVEVKDGKTITFLDTPGHEAFTAMRARGAKVTDLAIIIIAADDDIMPQTEEAISHTQAADVPIIFAINKVDKVNADPQKIKQQLAERNLLIEEWGGKYQSVDISAKNGDNVDGVLEEVMLAAEMLELKANPNKSATGTIIEAQLDKGRGYVSTVLIDSGTLKLGDIIHSGSHSGRVKAMYDERNNGVESAGPAEPVLVLGLNGAPVAGEKFAVMKDEKEARDLAQKYSRIKREQSFRAHKHITLDEIGRRIKVGNFKELNIIIRGDVIGSIEALADSFIKQSNEEIQVNIIQKAVGQITEADVNLAVASDAVIIGFQVRPSLEARKLAEQEQIDIRTYSVIYHAIEELRDAMEGMLSPEIKEEIRATVEVRDIFKISKVGTIAGCYVMDGKIRRQDKIRLIRDGVVIFTGEIDALKRYKDDVKEVPKAYECGLSIEKYNDIKKDDIIESFEEIEIAKKLA